jgi:polyisoprenoid-binding protein YceI
MKSTPLFLSALLLCGALHAADIVRYEAQPGGGKLSLEGKSTHGEWKVECGAIGGFLEADASFPESTASPAKPKVEISIPVRQLKSGKKAMDTRMMSELNQPAHPKIEYRVLDLKPKGAPSGGKADFDAIGAMTVSGVTSTNTMSVTIERLDKTKLKVTGAIQVRMTEFGIKPPTFDVPVLGGLMKTDDNVKITFEWTPEVEKK